jgi:hypothetical protein
MPKVIEECLSFSEVLITSLPSVVVNEDLISSMVFIFLKHLSSPKQQIKLSANSLINLCQQEIGDSTLMVTLLEIMSIDHVIEDVMTITSALEVLNILILNCKNLDVNRISISVDTLMNILAIHINTKMVQMPIFGAILALRDKNQK